MQDPQPYVDPIIRAMQATAELKERAAERQSREKTAAEDRKLREQALKDAAAQFEKEHELNMQKHEAVLKQIEIQRMQADADSFRNLVDSSERLNKISATGGDPRRIMETIKSLRGLGLGGLSQLRAAESQGPQTTVNEIGQTVEAPPEQQPETALPQYNYSPATGPSGLPISGFATPQSAAQAQGLLDKAKADAEADARARLAEAEAKLKERFEKVKFDIEQPEKKTERAFKASESEKERAKDIQVEEIRAGARAGAANQPKPDEVQRSAAAGYAGLEDISGDNPHDRQARNLLYSMGGQLVDTKELKNLRQMQKLVPSFDKIRDFAKTLSPSKGGAFVQGLEYKLADAADWPTKMRDAYNQIKVDATALGTSLEGITGRVLLRQLEAEVNSLAKPGITREQAVGRLNNLMIRYFTQQEEIARAGKSDEQWAAILKANGITPASKLFGSEPQEAAMTPRLAEELKLAPKQLPNGMVLSIEDSIRVGKPAYKRP